MVFLGLFIFFIKQDVVCMCACIRIISSTGAFSFIIESSTCVSLFVMGLQAAGERVYRHDDVFTPYKYLQTRGGGFLRSVRTLVFNRCVTGLFSYDFRENQHQCD